MQVLVCKMEGLYEFDPTAFNLHLAKEAVTSEYPTIKSTKPRNERHSRTPLEQGMQRANGSILPGPRFSDCRNSSKASSLAVPGPG